MHETAPAALSAWSNFYVITGSAAAALTGLMFVVVTLVSQTGPNARQGVPTFGTPTVVHFTMTLLISLIVVAPWQWLEQVRVPLVLCGAFGLAYIAVLAPRMARLDHYQVPLEDRIWFLALPLAAYLTMLAAGLRLAAAPVPSLFALAGAVALLIVIGIHNAWDIVTYIAIQRAGEPPPSA